MSDTVVRAFELPVQSVESVDGRDGWALLRECWQEATTLSNWGVQQLLRVDVVRLPGVEKLPKRPPVNGKKLKGLYGLASETFGFKTGWWAGACVSASTLLRGVESKYDSERLEVIWRRNKAPCTYRYPSPWPVHAQGWKGAGFDSEGRPWVLCSLPGGLVKLTLRGGVGKDRQEFARQLALFRRVVEGDLPRKQLVIRQQGSSQGCHRPTVQDGGRPRRVMVKMVAELPVQERPGNRTLVLLTDPSAFWVAELDGRRAWVLNADHLKRLVLHAEHLRWLQRVSEDGKAERRIGSNRYQKVQRRLERASLKDRNRLASWTHESASHLAGFAQRQRVGNVLYLDRDKGFCERFPWHELTGKLQQKLQLAGIGFYTESGLELPSNEDVEGEESQDGNFMIDLRPAGDDEQWVRITKLREMAARKVLAARSRKRSHPAVSAP